MGIPLAPSTYKEPSFWENAEHEITRARFEQYDFVKSDGTIAGSKNGLVLGILTNGIERSDFWSYGSEDFFEPSANGLGLDPIGTQDALNPRCGAARLIASLVDAGMEDKDVGEDISVVEGIKFTGRTEVDKGRDGKEYSVQLVDRIIEMPGARKKAQTNAAAVSADAVVDAVVDALMGAGGSMVRNQLSGAIRKSGAFKKTGAEWNAVVAFLQNDEFMGGNDGWALADGVLTLND